MLLQKTKYLNSIEAYCDSRETFNFRDHSEKRIDRVYTKMIKQLLLHFVILVSALASSTSLKAAEVPYSHDSFVGFLYGTIPLVGHAVSFNAFRIFSTTNEAYRISPGVFGLASGTTFWALTPALLMRLRPDKKWWEAYLMASSPGVIGLAILGLENMLINHSRKRTRKHVR